MWISVRYHTNSAPNQWIAEWGEQNAQCSHLRQAMPSALSTTLGHSPLSSNRGCWGYKLWPRAHIMAHGPTPDGTSCTDSYQQWLSTQQCPNMRRSKRKAYWNILRENSTVKQHSAKCASLFWGLPAARRMDCTSTSLSAVHIELR